MRRRILAASALAVLLATPALAMFEPKRPTPEPGAGPGAAPSAAVSASPRQKAERLYAQGYEDVARAGKDLEAGKESSAKKRLQRALERAERAAALDSSYHEALNLAGYAARRLGDYPRSVAHYEHCLRVEPDYAPAREYLGEAYVEMGELARAREQLVWLERVGTPEQARALRSRIEAAAPRDTTVTSGGR